MKEAGVEGEENSPKDLNHPENNDTAAAAEAKSGDIENVQTNSSAKNAEEGKEAEDVNEELVSEAALNRDDEVVADTGEDAAVVQGMEGKQEGTDTSSPTSEAGANAMSALEAIETVEGSSKEAELIAAGKDNDDEQPLEKEQTGNSP